MIEHADLREREVHRDAKREEVQRFPGKQKNDERNDERLMLFGKKSASRIRTHGICLEDRRSTHELCRLLLH